MLAGTSREQDLALNDLRTWAQKANRLYRLESADRTFKVQLLRAYRELGLTSKYRCVFLLDAHIPPWVWQLFSPAVVQVCLDTELLLSLPC